MPAPEEELRSVIATGRAVLVAGTGVSIAASGKHPQADWAGLLKHGLDWLLEHKHLTDEAVRAYKLLLGTAPSTQMLITVAQQIREKMSDESFKEWLGQTVGAIQPKHPEVLDALEALRNQGHLLATTNYDSLLLRDGLEPVTWRDTDALLGALRQGANNQIIFLHGYWRRPESVILDWRSYDGIARDGAYRDDLAAFWKTSVWVYIGCGTAGISDPDFGLLLETHGQRARRAGHWDFCLVRAAQREEFQSFFDANGYNIRAVSFGADHAALPRFLGKLLPAPSAAPAPDRRPFRAVPDYIGSHKFLGRQAELQALNDWVQPADPANLLIFDAIGGTGKSMLTWHWVNDHAPRAPQPWAGRFWYSFYERGAIMSDFCRQALAYMTGRSLQDLADLPVSELGQQLLEQLHAAPWLLVLDGLERVLVAYHRIDAASVPDEDANAPTDAVLSRDPCNTIREEDGALLRRLAAAKPSKILVTSRLIPRVLLNPSGQPVDGAKRITLPGLRPAEAEALLRSCGITGEGKAIQEFLTANCDNHPLTIGMVAGLVANYLPKRNDFDAWLAADGARLNLAELNLIQRRNHILRAAMGQLPPDSRQVLALLALCSEPVDFGTLKTLAQTEISGAVRDLESRGLFQYDVQSKRYDLHPVVRGVAAGGLDGEEKDQLGNRVVDHFSSLPHPPWEEAKTLEDVAPGLNLVRTLLRLGRFEAAADAYRGALSRALLFNLEAYGEVLSLLKPFFPSGWGGQAAFLSENTARYVTNDAAVALNKLGKPELALEAYGALIRLDLRAESWSDLSLRLRNVAAAQESMAVRMRLYTLAFAFAERLTDPNHLYRSSLEIYFTQSKIGAWTDADQTWELLSRAPVPEIRAILRPGTAERYFAWSQFWRGNHKPDHLDRAVSAAHAANSRFALRELAKLRGEWHLEREEPDKAAIAFEEAVAMARQSRILDGPSECGLALARFLAGLIDEPRGRQEAKRLVRQPYSSYHIARLWHALGDRAQAARYARIAYETNWADGEPYVYRYDLTRAAALLTDLGEPIPNLPPYDPAKAEKFPWEAEVEAAIEGFISPLRRTAIEWKQYLEGERSRVDVPSPPPGFPAFRFRHVRLRNVTVFKDSGIIDVSRDTVVFLGDNAAGKSTVLKCLAFAAMGLDAANQMAEGTANNFLAKGSDWGAIEAILEIVPAPDSGPNDSKLVLTGLMISKNSSAFEPLPDHLLTLRTEGIGPNCIERLTTLRAEVSSSVGLVCAYGAGRVLNENRLGIDPEHANPVRESILSLFNPEAPLSSPESLRRLLRGDTRNIPNAPDELDSAVKEALRKRLSALIPDATLEPEDSESDLAIGGAAVGLSQLSDGYKSILALFGHLVRCIFRHYSWSVDPFSARGVLIIDEIDLHLHPLWQTAVIRRLRELLPNFQMFASTHSPLVVANLEREEVYRIAAGNVEHPSASPEGMGFSGILKSDMFGLTSTVDQKTLEKIDRRNRLFALGDQRTEEQNTELTNLSAELSRLGLATDFRDPYYEQFVKAMAATSETPEKPLFLTHDQKAQQLNRAKVILAKIKGVESAE